jgi:hypothetical protein
VDLTIVLGGVFRKDYSLPTTRAFSKIFTLEQDRLLFRREAYSPLEEVLPSTKDGFELAVALSSLLCRRCRYSL